MSLKLKNFYIFIFFLVIIILTGYFFSTKYKIIKIKNQFFFAEIANSREKQELGLSKRENIRKNGGMLFDFKKNEKHAFWMKGMNFDLDIIWVNKGKIAYIAKNISHNNLDIINPDINSDQVLEIRAGLSEEYSFKVGDEIDIKN